MPFITPFFRTLHFSRNRKCAVDAVVVSENHFLCNLLSDFLLLLRFLLGTARVFYATPRNPRRWFFMDVELTFLDFFV